mmetsp:Transcript_17931/g.36429  ORF Transcript_17931/g.36429 Transcript_17931/m.36429 type:complete len:212 (-) Transcript_17931:425-1060(-)
MRPINSIRFHSIMHSRTHSLCLSVLKEQERTQKSTHKNTFGAVNVVLSLRLAPGKGVVLALFPVPLLSVAPSFLFLRRNVFVVQFLPSTKKQTITNDFSFIQSFRQRRFPKPMHPCICPCIYNLTPSTCPFCLALYSPLLLVRFVGEKRRGAVSTHITSINQHVQRRSLPTSLLGSQVNTCPFSLPYLLTRPSGPSTLYHSCKNFASLPIH